MKLEKYRFDPSRVNKYNLSEVEEALLYNRYLLRRTTNKQKQTHYEQNIQVLQQQYLFLQQSASLELS